MRCTNEIAILEVESVQLVAGLLGVHNIFIDNKGGALGSVGNSLADLAAQAVSVCCDTAAMDKCWARGAPDWAEFTEEFEELFRSDVVG